LLSFFDPRSFSFFFLASSIHPLFFLPSLSSFPSGFFLNKLLVDAKKSTTSDSASIREFVVKLKAVMSEFLSFTVKYFPKGLVWNAKVSCCCSVLF
jgi:hypothetical protein